MTENLLIAIGVATMVVASLQIALLVSSRSRRRSLKEMRGKLESLPAEMRQDNSYGRQELAQSLFAALNQVSDSTRESLRSQTEALSRLREDLDRQLAFLT